VALVVWAAAMLLSGFNLIEVDKDEIHGRSEGAHASPPRRRLALLVYGVRLETLFETGRSIMKYVVEPTDADVFVYGREVAEYNTTGAVRAAFGTTRVKGIFTGRQLDEGDIDALVGQSKRHAELMAVCGGTNLLKAGTLNGLIWGQKAYELAASYERAQGFQYDYMVFMRPDVEWFAPFPPLSLLDTKKQVWLPTRTPWGGIPASLIVCPRGLCQHWALLWDHLRDGIIVDAMAKKNVWTKRNCLMSEMLEYAYWKAAEVPFGWFSVVHAIVCAKTLCLNGDQCYLGKSICSPGQKYKYDEQESWFEATVAKKNSNRIKKDGWKESEMRYNCYITTEIIRQFRRDFKRTGQRVPLPWKYDANALHPEPPWTPLDHDLN
jgi:hypothetical protein